MSASGDADRLREEILTVMHAWARAFSGEDPAAMLSLYADEAILWGTFSITRQDGRLAIRKYFEKVFTYDRRAAEFRDPVIRVYGNTAVNTGSYMITLSQDDRITHIPARYSFVYLKRDSNWLIVDHHSSAMPAIRPDSGTD